MPLPGHIILVICVDIPTPYTSEDQNKDGCLPTYYMPIKSGSYAIEIIADCQIFHVEIWKLTFINQYIYSHDSQKQSDNCCEIFQQKVYIGNI